MLRNKLEFKAVINISWQSSTYNEQVKKFIRDVAGWKVCNNKRYFYNDTIITFHIADEKEGENFLEYYVEGNVDGPSDNINDYLPLLTKLAKDEITNASKFVVTPNFPWGIIAILAGISITAYILGQSIKPISEASLGIATALLIGALAYVLIQVLRRRR